MSVDLSDILSDEEMEASGLTAEDLSSMDEEPVSEDPSDVDAEADDDSGDDSSADDGGDGDDDGTDADDAEAKGEADEPQPAAAGSADDRGPSASYEATLPEDFDARLADVTKRTDELEAKYRDGDISFDEFRTEERRLQAEARELDRIKTKAEISSEQAEQRGRQEWEWSVRRFKRDQKAAGVDYDGDPKLDKSLDQFVRVLAQDPENAERDADWFLTEAHKRVLIMHGIEQGGGDSAPKAPAKPKEPPRKVKRESVPVTLAELEGGDSAVDDIAGEFADLDRLEGEAYERAFEKMSPAQRDRYLANG